MMEPKVSAWSKKNSKRAYRHSGFQKQYSTVDHLVTLWVLMEETCLKGKGLYCCFTDFKKAFEPHKHLWKVMEEIRGPNECVFAIS